MLQQGAGMVSIGLQVSVQTVYRWGEHYRAGDHGNGVTCGIDQLPALNGFERGQGFLAGFERVAVGALAGSSKI